MNKIIFKIGYNKKSTPDEDVNQAICVFYEMLKSNGNRVVAVTDCRDYFIKEINCLVMLCDYFVKKECTKEQKENFIKNTLEEPRYLFFCELDAVPVEVLKANMECYDIDGEKCVFDEYGFEVKSMDVVIERQNRLSDLLVWGD